MIASCLRAKSTSDVSFQQHSGLAVEVKQRQRCPLDSSVALFPTWGVFSLYIVNNVVFLQKALWKWDFSSKM